MEHLTKQNSDLKDMTMKKLNTLLATAIMGISSATIAAPLESVNVDVPNEFTSGQVISAAQMNANFTELETGVNENAAQISSNFTALGDEVDANEALIAALTQRIEALEANSSGGEPLPAPQSLEEAIDGQRYKLQSTYTGFFGEQGSNGLTNYVRYLQGLTDGTVSFNDGAFVLDSTYTEHEGLTTPVFCPEYGQDGCLTTPGNDQRINSEDEVEQGTYSVNESTGQVTLDFGGETIVLQSTLDGALMYIGEYYVDIDGEQEQREIANTMLIRMPAPIVLPPELP